MSEKERKSWETKREQAMAHLERFQDFMNTFDPETRSLTELKLRLSLFEPVYNDFSIVQGKIEAVDSCEAQKENRIAFENGYFALVARAKDILDDHVERNSTPEVASSSVDTQSIIKLPTLNLPEFDGSYDKWLQFSETFEAIINKNLSLTNIQRFYYLQASLKGEAAQCIQSLQVSEANYHVAWQLLRERYYNKRIIISTHVRALFEYPSINRECHTSLRKLLDHYLKHTRALASLGEPTENWATLLIHLITTKLDSQTKRGWESTSSNTDNPTFDDLSNFLINRCRILEASAVPTVSKPGNYNKSDQRLSPNKRNEMIHAHVSTNNFNRSCPLCKGSHELYYCKKLLSLNPRERLNEVKRVNACTNCLRLTHATANCLANGCKFCGRRHNSRLHFNANDAQQEASNAGQSEAKNTVRESTKNNDVQESSRESSVTVVANLTTLTSSNQQNESCFAILSTAIINVFGCDGKEVECRALLDSGSQSNFVTTCLFEKLGLNSDTINLTVKGIGNTTSFISNKSEIIIKSRFNGYKRKLPFLIVGKITSEIPTRTYDTKSIKIPYGLKLADDRFNVSQPIDVLLGAGVFYELLCVGQIKLGIERPILQKTRLGWIVSGEMHAVTNDNISQVSLCNLSIEDRVEKFWKIEEIASNTLPNTSNHPCEIDFLKTHERDETGRFIVSLPTKPNAPALGESKETAIRRFERLEAKLLKDRELHSKYSEFMEEYERLGHMSKIEPEYIDNAPETTYYLPHHGVVRESSMTTKLRVVFDASCKTSSGASLNDTLLVGPTIQDDLFSILTRFRTHKYVLIADIEKMYRQVNIREKQRDFQRIVWRKDPKDELNHYRLNTVTYGTAPASFLATRCLNQLANENENKYREACSAIINDMYVDDLITGANSVQDAIQLREDITHILNTGHFPLRKWMSNDEAILKNIQRNEKIEYHVTDETCVKTLGVLWNAELDSFGFVTANVKNDNYKRVTKRSILSDVSRLFDPLGLLGPVIIIAKILLQDLWSAKIAWDESVPIDIATRWSRLKEQIAILSTLKIPRNVIALNHGRVEIHGFCDASEAAYGACVYVRTTNAQGSEVVTRLLCAKSRVAPLKKITLPRLELSGALLLSKLVSKVINSFKSCKIDDVYLWTDSTIVLNWIFASSDTWKTFVANRVSEIQSLTQGAQWNHVRSHENPADLISRGILPNALIESHLWWSGPSWLSREYSCWPTPFTNGEISEIPEKRKTNTTVGVAVSNDFDIFERFSSFSKLQRTVAYCFRFVRNSLSKFKRNDKITGSLTTAEIVNATRALILASQSASFTKEIAELKRNGMVSKKSKILSLSPFLENGILRVGGRLKNAVFNADQKHPILMHDKHPLTKLIIRGEHVRNLHCGVQGTLAAVRQRFWPIKGKHLTKAVLRECVTCFKVKPSGLNPPMGDLPATRVTPVRPFYNVGIDFAGPFSLKDGKLRNRQIIKGYLCLFVCFTTKAVHLELVGDLSTNSFLNALKRFVSRRGICKNIYSDNATNFVGAKNYLNREINYLKTMQKQDRIANFLTSNSINWHYIPARSPHFGGLWEAGIKSAKFHLRRIVGNVALTYEDFNTVLTQIEAVMNSRPISPMSSDPNDLSFLTPGHFLIYDALNSIPEREIEEVQINRLDHYRRLKLYLQHFWKRWSREYASTLQQRSKWKWNVHSSLKEGAMVLLKNVNTPPQQWPVGRVVKVHAGHDGIVRVADVQTAKCVTRRAVRELCPLPIEDGQD